MHRVLYRHVKFGVARESQECFGVSDCQSCFCAAKFETATSPRRRWNLEVVSISFDSGKFWRNNVQLCLYAATQRHHICLLRVTDQTGSDEI